MNIKIESADSEVVENNLEGLYNPANDESPVSQNFEVGENVITDELLIKNS